MWFHPAGNLQKASIVIANKNAFLATPAQVSNGSNFINSWRNIKTIVDFEIIDSVGHKHLKTFV